MDKRVNNVKFNIQIQIHCSGWTYALAKVSISDSNVEGTRKYCKKKWKKKNRVYILNWREEYYELKNGLTLLHRSI